MFRFLSPFVLFCYHENIKTHLLRLVIKVTLIRTAPYLKLGGA